MYKKIQALALSVTMGIVLSGCCAMTVSNAETVQETEEPIIFIQTELPTKETEVTTEPETVEDIPDEEEITMSEEDVQLIALLMMAEAEGEPEEGQRLVIDTVLNRVDSIHFPDAVHSVIYQKGHFSSMWNGRVNRVSATEYARKLVREELKSRLNYEVIYFTAGRYSKYGKPMFIVGNHYFSSYE